MDEETSEFYKQLDDAGKARYRIKLQLIGSNQDIYLLPSNDWSSSSNAELWHTVDFPDIYVYLINSPSLYTKESLKAYKSTEAWATL